MLFQGIGLIKASEGGLIIILIKLLLRGLGETNKSLKFKFKKKIQNSVLIK